MATAERHIGHFQLLISAPVIGGPGRIRYCASLDPAVLAALYADLAAETPWTRFAPTAVEAAVSHSSSRRLVARRTSVTAIACAESNA